MGEARDGRERDRHEFRMPSLGADMEHGVLLEWLVRPGDTVHKGDIVAVVDTSKAAVEVECFASGVIEQLLVPPGTRVAVGTILATIATEGEVEPVISPTAPPLTTTTARTPPAIADLSTPALPPGAPSRVTSPLVRHLAAELQVDLDSVRGTGVGGRVTHADVRRSAAAGAASVLTPTAIGPQADRRVKVSPLARRLAAELGVDVATVRGSGPGGVIRVEDVRRAAPARPTPAGETIPAGATQRTEAMRAAIAALMARSKREIPHYYLTETVDLGIAMGWMHERNRTLAVPERLVPAVLLLKAAARAAAAVPELNGFWSEDHYVPASGVHLGVAVSLRGGGLVAPAIHDADGLELPDLMAALRDLVSRTRTGRLRRAEMADPTITVSNLGDQGVESILGVIYPPQVALVGFGRVTERPWAIDGLLGVRPTVTVSLAADHRASDGATGARYLQAVTRLLQKPEEL